MSTDNENKNVENTGDALGGEDDLFSSPDGERPQNGAERGGQGYVFDFGARPAESVHYGAPGGYGYPNGGAPNPAGGSGGGGVDPDVYMRRGRIGSGQAGNEPPKKKKNVKKIVACCAGAVAIAAGGFFAGYFTYQGMLDPQMRSLIWAKKQIENQYYQEIPDDEFYKAIFEAMNGLLDPYSGYLTADEFADMREDALGKWSGLGVTFSTKDAETNSRLLITRVSGNSPAEAAGIRAGMYIVGFGLTEAGVKESTSYDELTEFMTARGAGEPFVLKMTLGTDGEPFYKTVSKETFVENYVFYRSDDSAYIFTGEKATTLTVSDNYLTALDEDTAYIRLTQFNGNAAEEFAIAMDKFREEEKKNLVLDLRSNGGGYLEILCDIASYFCKSAVTKEPVVAIADYPKKSREKFVATGNRYDEYFSADSRISVLADNGTASASECLIGCMIDYGTISYSDIYLSARGEETKTYGKGIMQSTIPRGLFGNPDAIKLTTARILWPLSENCIHDRGVLPEDGAHPVSENLAGDAEILEAWEMISGNKK